MTSALRRSQPASQRLTASPRPCPAKASPRSVSAAVRGALYFRVRPSGTDAVASGSASFLSSTASTTTARRRRGGVRTDQKAGEGIAAWSQGLEGVAKSSARSPEDRRTGDLGGNGAVAEATAKEA